jgi:hypothetical protein
MKPSADCVKKCPQKAIKARSRRFKWLVNTNHARRKKKAYSPQLIDKKKPSEEGLNLAFCKYSQNEG